MESLEFDDLGFGDEEEDEEWQNGWDSMISLNANTSVGPDEQGKDHKPGM